MALYSNAVAAFIVQYAMELAAGAALLLMLTSLILLIILMRRRPEDFIAKLHDKLLDLDHKQARLESVVKDEIMLNRQETALNDRQARVVELRFFGGLDVEHTAHVLGVSPRTVKDDWRFARAWLRARLRPEAA